MVTLYWHVNPRLIAADEGVQLLRKTDYAIIL